MRDWCESQLARAVASAKGIIAELGLRDPDEIDIETIAYLRGASVSDSPLVGCEGRMVRRGKRGFITVSSTIREPGRRRFAIAHELGHFELHAKSGDGQLSAFRDAKLGQFLYHKVNPEEREADAFASALLMPEEMFGPRCQGFKPDFYKIEALANEFNTTLTATATRYIAYTPYDCVLIFSRDGTRRRFIASEDFPLRVALNGLDPHSSAATAFETRQSSPGMKRAPARFWFEGSSVPQNLMVYEESRVLGSYGSMLTIVWLDQPVVSGAWYNE